ncbi:uncharacterized protein LOC129860667 isoform X2 [Salvelinus fontinalis]|uniref:uncharacterized protein LOC129860667 isoform X2 n=1 Tax=Salvelinus fontinalis TaxID=8038 RepID=UPI00248621C0|nr:uncharacterized protein LOC129860667 isoform X2 [Salvelinus fontinalis]
MVSPCINSSFYEFDCGNTSPGQSLSFLSKQRAAWIDKYRPDILILESTSATTIRDSKRCRERDFLKNVHETVERGERRRGSDSSFCPGKSSGTVHSIGNILGADEHKGPPSTSPQGSQRKPITSTNSSSPGPIRRSEKPLYRETCLSSNTSRPLIAPMQTTKDQWCRNIILLYATAITLLYS